MGILGKILTNAASGVVRDSIEKAIQNMSNKEDAEKQAGQLDALTAKAENAVKEAKEAAEQPDLTPEQQEQAAKANEVLKGFGTLFSGAVEMAKREAAAEEAARKAAEQAVFDNWAENLPAYPVWDVGGSHFELEEETPMNGHPAFQLRLTGRPFLVEQYAAKLRADGFVAKGCSNPADLNADTYYKMIDGVCHAFNRTDACYDGHITVSFYVDNYVPKPRQEPRQQAPVGDLKDVAKGIFKKFF